MEAAVTATSLPFTLFRRGKVRDVYDLGENLLIIATDRISAFDVVMPDGIPDKGKILTAMSLFWFGFTRDIVPNHLVAHRVEDYPAALRPHAALLRGRSMLVRKTVPFPVECVVRGYLAGSGWNDYRKNGAICGIPLPAGLRNAEKLPHAVFTPSTKAESGHDLNITYEAAEKTVGKANARALRDFTVRVYERCADHARGKGIIIADTKFEFGAAPEGIILIDEVLTPDSSRFWPASSYEVGKNPPSFDKQYLRDWLETLSWNKTPPGPALPPEVVRRTRDKYLEAHRLLMGKEFAG
jgi:phosphoribosylaminoimidazole-succinocarboxamide synthase